MNSRQGALDCPDADTEMSPSWSRAHDWKSCNRQKRFESSNLSISATENLQKCRLFFYLCAMCILDAAPYRYTGRRRNSGKGETGMNTFLKLAFLFFIGSVLGWVLELLFRRFLSGNNPERKWINPGFMVGPYVPLYGSGLCILYLVSRLAERNTLASPLWNNILMLLLMAAAMTGIEYLAGILLLKVMKTRLWDYSRRWGNVNGLICPLFSAVWAVMGAMYYFFVDPYILRALDWLSRNLAFSFVIGVFFGVFAIDFVYSTHLMVRIRSFAREKNIVVRYEELKAYLKEGREKGRQHFFLALHTELPLREQLQLFEEYRRGRREELDRILHGEIDGEQKPPQQHEKQQP